MSRHEIEIEYQDINHYFIDKYTDAILMLTDFESSKELIDDNLLREDNYLYYLNDKMEYILESKIYPKIVINNLGKMIKHIKEINGKNDLLKELSKKYEKIENLEDSDELYTKEFCLKYSSIDNLNKDFNVNELRKSIILDFQVLCDLIYETESKYEYDSEKSIRKFMFEYPEMFLDKEISKNTINILEKNNTEDSNKLIRKIKKMKRKELYSFDMNEYKRLYYYILLQNMMANKLDNKIVIENFYDDIDYLIEYLHIEIDSDMICDERMKQKTIDIMFEIREYMHDNLDIEDYKEFLKTHNEYLSKINCLNINANKYYYEEYMRRATGKDKFKYTFEPLQNNLLLLNDLSLLQLYIKDEETYNKEKEAFMNNDKINLSVNKFIYLYPSLFDDEIILNRTLEILDANKKNKNLCKKIRKDYK